MEFGYGGEDEVAKRLIVGSQRSLRPFELPLKDYFVVRSIRVMPMGVFYMLFELNAETTRWLKEIDYAMPPLSRASRLPSLGEVKNAVEHLDGYSATVRMQGSDMSVDIEIVDNRGYSAGWSTTIWAWLPGDNARLPDDDDLVTLTFHKGNPELAVLIAEKLSKVCGPLVLIEDAGCRPLLVTTGCDPRQAVDEWLM